MLFPPAMRMRDGARPLSLEGGGQGEGWSRLRARAVSGNISGNSPRVSTVSSTKKKAIASYRQRMKRRGLVRVEVQARKEDAALLRSVASALADPEHGAETRALLRERIASQEVGGLKALLAAAPFEGVDLERVRDMGRALEL